MKSYSVCVSIRKKPGYRNFWIAQTNSLSGKIHPSFQLLLKYLPQAGILALSLFTDGFSLDNRDGLSLSVIRLAT